MTLIVCNEPSHYETKDFLEKKLLMVKNAMAASGVTHHEEEEDFVMKFSRYIPLFGKMKKKKFRKDFPTDVEPLALIIDGRTLDFALEPDIAPIFLELATLCKSVVCCRVSPLQKALVVKLVKKNIDDSITLAIGDGANDVGMIQAAHVGVGISGMEGLQAARSADFAIAQFRFLRKLLLVHGGWSYSRLSKTLYESWILACYNVIFAVFQPIAIGIFDQYVSARMLDRYPQLYQLGQRSQFYNHRAFWTWILNSFFHSMLMFLFFISIYGETTILADGRSANLWLLGSMVYTTDVIVITMKASVISDLWVKFTYLAIFGGVALWFVVFPIYATVAPLIPFSEELNGIVAPMFTSGTFCVKHQFFPQSYHIVQEIQKFNIPDYRPRMEWFRKAVHKVRQIQRLKRNRGYAFSQNESGQASLIRVYDTTRRKPK
ncbi:hypothetical protein HK096_006686, partial [Nowakowskiella sp. JEL0078]